MKTHYSIAWEEFTTTPDYLTSVETMKNKHMSQPYIDNILRRAFDAGYCLRVKSAFKQLVNDKSGKNSIAGKKGS